MFRGFHIYTIYLEGLLSPQCHVENLRCSTVTADLSIIDQTLQLLGSLGLKVGMVIYQHNIGPPVMHKMDDQYPNQYELFSLNGPMGF